MTEYTTNTPVATPPVGAPPVGAPPRNPAASRKQFSQRFEQNEAIISGVVENVPTHGPALFGEECLFFTLRATRLSGTADHIPVCIPVAIAQRHSLQLLSGDILVVYGQVRSYYSESDRHMQTVLYAALASYATEDPGINSIRLTGEITKPPVYNVTPFGREITIANLCVPYSATAYRGVAHVPVMFWGSYATIANTYKPRETIHIYGRFQSRDYQKVMADGVIEYRVAHEVSCHHCTPIQRNFLANRGVI